jgi:hypothetical protein
MKLIPLEGEIQTIFVACRRNDVTLTMVTVSATINTAFDTIDTSFSGG